MRLLIRLPFPVAALALLVFGTSFSGAQRIPESEFFRQGAGSFIRGELERAKQIVGNGLLSYPQSRRLHKLSELLEEQQQQEQDQEQQEQEQEQKQKQQDHNGQDDEEPQSGDQQGDEGESGEGSPDEGDESSGESQTPEADKEAGDAESETGDEQQIPSPTEDQNPEEDRAQASSGEEQTPGDEEGEPVVIQGVLTEAEARALLESLREEGRVLPLREEQPRRRDHDGNRPEW